MKRIILAVLVLSLCVCLALTASAAHPEGAVSPNDGTDRFTIEAPKFTPAVDGVLDDGYGPLYSVEQFGVASTQGLDLTTGKVAVAWDDTNLYFYCEVYDNNEPFAVSTTDWKNDGPEFFLDLDNDKAGDYLEDDFRVRVIAAYESEGSIWQNPLSYNGQNGNAPVPNACDDDFTLAVKLLGEKWSDGYAVELAYNYTNYDRAYAAGDEIGFEVQIVDDVFGFGSRDSQAFLGNPADAAWCNPSSFGSNIVLTSSEGASSGSAHAQGEVTANNGTDRFTVDAPYATPAVDGVLDDGYGPLYSVEQFGVASTQGLDLTTGKVAVAWDDSKLYFYCEIYDNNEPFAVSKTDWQCDGPEFFLDLDNDKAGDYLDDDFRVRVIAAYESEGSIWENPLSYNGQNGNNPVPNACDDDFELAVKLLGEKWSDGYAVELAYNYANYDRVYGTGDEIGFEVQIVDDVFGFGSRDSQAFLGNPADAAWCNPSSFGSNIVLSGGTAKPAEEKPAVEEPTYSYPASGESGNSLVGTVIGNAEGWGGNAAAGAAAAFDGNPATFFDPLGQGDGYCGMDMGRKVVLEKVAILSRHVDADWNGRFKGAEIRGNNVDDVNTAVTLWKSDIEGTAPDYYVVTDFENNDGYQYYFYYNTENHGDVAEVEFYGKDYVEEAPVVEEPETEPEVVETPADTKVDEELEAKAEAPQTFDFGVIAMVAVVLSLAGFAFSKKR